MRCWHPLNTLWHNCYSMTMGALYEQRGYNWSHQVSDVVTTQWLQCDQNLPLSVKGVVCETTSYVTKPKSYAFTRYEHSSISDVRTAYWTLKSCDINSVFTPSGRLTLHSHLPTLSLPLPYSPFPSLLSAPFSPLTEAVVVIQPTFVEYGGLPMTVGDIITDVEPVCT